MTRLPVTLGPKLARLLPRLASDHDGEVVATTRAIRRTLASAGGDLHDLAAALTRPVAPPRIVYREPPPAQGSASTVTLNEARERIAWLLEEPAQLSPREDEFLQSLRGQLRAGRPLSEKQAAWLQSIYVRCFVSGDHP